VPNIHKLGDLQLAIMHQLWAAGETTVAAIHQALHPSRGLALTTIATMLRKMEDKGLVTHHQDGRTYIYRALVARNDVHHSMVGDLLDRLFKGDTAALVNHLLEHREVNADELAEIKAMIAAKERESSSSDRSTGDE
jgi:BlaI family penicillinase repressor